MVRTDLSLYSQSWSPITRCRRGGGNTTSNRHPSSVSLSFPRASESGLCCSLQCRESKRTTHQSSPQPSLQLQRARQQLTKTQRCSGYSPDEHVHIDVHDSERKAITHEVLDLNLLPDCLSEYQCPTGPRYRFGTGVSWKLRNLNERGDNIEQLELPELGTESHTSFTTVNSLGRIGKAIEVELPAGYKKWKCPLDEKDKESNALPSLSSRKCLLDEEDKESNALPSLSSRPKSSYHSNCSIPTTNTCLSCSQSRHNSAATCSSNPLRMAVTNLAFLRLKPTELEVITNVKTQSVKQCLRRGFTAQGPIRKGKVNSSSTHKHHHGQANIEESQSQLPLTTIPSSYRILHNTGTMQVSSVKIHVLSSKHPLANGT